MINPLPKPEKRGPKPPKPLQRKTPLKSYKVDKNGIPILRPNNPPKRKVSEPTKKIQPYQKSTLKSKFDPLWAETRKLWFAQNPPTIGEYYQCALCPYMVHQSETTLDHIITRTADVTLKYTLSNLQPAHAICNQVRGSMSMESYRRRYPFGPPQNPYALV